MTQEITSERTMLTNDGTNHHQDRVGERVTDMSDAIERTGEREIHTNDQTRHGQGHEQGTSNGKNQELMERASGRTIYTNDRTNHRQDLVGE